MLGAWTHSDPRWRALALGLVGLLLLGCEVDQPGPADDLARRVGLVLSLGEEALPDPGASPDAALRDAVPRDERAGRADRVLPEAASSPSGGAGEPRVRAPSTAQVSGTSAAVKEGAPPEGDEIKAPRAAAPARYPPGCGRALPCNPSGPLFPWLAGHASEDRFTHLRGAAGRVRDRATGLIWRSHALSERSWAEALRACRGLPAFRGRSWRLPWRSELQSLAHYGRLLPASDFPGMPDALDDPGSWTATTAAHDPRDALYVLGGEAVFVSAKTRARSVRCVLSRGAVAPGPGSGGRWEAVPHGRATLDRATGLLWQSRIGRGLTWAEARSACARSRLAGRRGWRLPSVMELSILVDSARPAPAVDPRVLPGARVGDELWTATDFQDPAKAWTLRLASGATGIWSKESRAGVVCVVEGKGD